eukprot:gene18058-biopygen4735
MRMSDSRSAIPDMRSDLRFPIRVTDLQLPICDSRPAIPDLQFPTSDLRSALRNCDPRSAIPDLRFPIRDVRSAIPDLRCPVCDFRSALPDFLFPFCVTNLRIPNCDFQYPIPDLRFLGMRFQSAIYDSNSPICITALPFPIFDSRSLIPELRSPFCDPCFPIPDLIGGGLLISASTFPNSCSGMCIRMLLFPIQRFAFPIPRSEDGYRISDCANGIRHPFSGIKDGSLISMLAEDGLRPPPVVAVGDESLVGPVFGAHKDRLQDVRHWHHDQRTHARGHEDFDHGGVGGVVEHHAAQHHAVRPGKDDGDPHRPGVRLPGLPGKHAEYRMAVAQHDARVLYFLPARDVTR